LKEIFKPNKIMLLLGLIKDNQMEYDHEYTRNIVCPYCGYEDQDSWEVMPREEDLGVIECGMCGEEFEAERDVNITYSTYKLKDLK
jgi:transcription elongation factor Elf1